MNAREKKAKSNRVKRFFSQSGWLLFWLHKHKQNLGPQILTQLPTTGWSWEPAGSSIRGVKLFLPPLGTEMSGYHGCSWIPRLSSPFHHCRRRRRHRSLCCPKHTSSKYGFENSWGHTSAHRKQCQISRSDATRASTEHTRDVWRDNGREYSVFAVLNKDMDTEHDNREAVWPSALRN